VGAWPAQVLDQHTASPGLFKRVREHRKPGRVQPAVVGRTVLVRCLGEGCDGGRQPGRVESDGPGGVTEDFAEEVGLGGALGWPCAAASVAWTAVITAAVNGSSCRAA